MLFIQVFAETPAILLSINEDAVQVYLIDENGEEIPLEVDITIKEISTRTYGSKNTYMMTAVASLDKSKSGSSTPSNGNIQVTASGTVYWTDNFGENNELTAVSARWDCLSGSIVSNAKANYGTRGPDMDISNMTGFKNVANPFSKTNLNISGTTMILETKATAKNTSGEEAELYLKVSPGIFD